MLELISPAGSPEAVVACVRSGADAVYLGLGSFTGRRRAPGFSGEEYENALRYCRVRGCKVYAAMNILASDAEIPEVISLAENAARAGADAIILRDLGLARVLRGVLPDMPFFADLRMGLHSLAGVRAAEELGFSRVALPRELSRDSLAHICAGATVGINVFVQGQSCVCEPGLCYMSAMASGRSANRGLCDGLCRRKYSLGGRKDDRPLSMKDWSLISHLDELEAMGVAGCFIEGRVQRPEYAAMATSMFREALDNGKQPQEQEKEIFRSAFASRGFTDGYFVGEKGPELFGWHTPSEDRDVLRALAGVRRDYSDGETRRVPVRFYALAEEGTPSRFVAIDGDGNRADALGPTPVPAEGTPLTAEIVEEVLYKTGGTPFGCTSVQARVSPGLSLSRDELAAVRQELLSRLAAKRRAVPEPQVNPAPSLPKAAPAPEHKTLIFQVLSASQLSPELAAMKPDYLYVPLEELAENYAAVRDFTRLGTKPVAVLPQIIDERERPEVLALLKKLRDLGVSEALTGNLGHIPLARAAGMSLRGDYGLNVFNSYTAEVLKDASFLSCTLSFELSLEQLRALRPPLDTELIVYGRLPVMTTESCLIKNSAGRCSCRSAGMLSDRRGAIYPVVREFGCRNTVLASHKLFLADRRADYESLNLWGVRLLFTTESPRECAEVAGSYLGVSKYRPNGLTRGRFYKGVD